MTSWSSICWMSFLLTFRVTRAADRLLFESQPSQADIELDRTLGMAQQQNLRAEGHLSDVVNTRNDPLSPACLQKPIDVEARCQDRGVHVFSGSRGAARDDGDAPDQHPSHIRAVTGVRQGPNRRAESIFPLHRCSRRHRSRSRSHASRASRSSRCRTASGFSEDGRKRVAKSINPHAAPNASAADRRVAAKLSCFSRLASSRARTHLPRSPAFTSTVYRRPAPPE